MGVERRRLVHGRSDGAGLASDSVTGESWWVGGWLLGAFPGCCAVALGCLRRPEACRSSVLAPLAKATTDLGLLGRLLTSLTHPR